MKLAVERALVALMASTVGSRGRSDPVKAVLQTQRSTPWARAALAVIAVTSAIVLVVMAGREPLSHSAPVNATSAQAPVTALFVLFAGAGVVALGSLVMLMWPGRRRKREDEPERVADPLRAHWIWKLLAALMPVALGAALVAAAVLGARASHHPMRPGGSGTAFRAAPGGHPARGGGAGFALAGWLPWTVLGIVFVALLAAAAVLLRRRADVEGNRFESSAARAAVEAAIGALDEAGSDARGAVLAAYAAMERTLAAHGVIRAQAEAPREFLHRVLASTAETEWEARTLTGLFEEARFSSHPIPERLRELALSALSALRGRLGTAEDG
jgi:hypothetical protein